MVWYRALHFQFINSIDQVPKGFWQQTKNGADPFCNYHFLAALEHSGSVSAETGWLPHHLIAYQGDTPVGMLPLYKKNHSYGEYVFDFAWAEAYDRHGIDYYPKLINAIPFTPVTGPRLFSTELVDEKTLIAAMFAYLKQQLPELNVSSIHSLFITETISQVLRGQACKQRLSVQFQWFNRNYASFDDFTAQFTARRRKTVRKERAKIAAQGIQIDRFHGAALQSQQMDFFYHCYRQTYMKRSGHSGYLSKRFFENILENMTDNILLVIASREQVPIAGALYFFNQQQLCGRYWGAIEEADALHFECCYYQGIEFCIEHNIDSFNPGTQGEHKILRGFEPIYCYSNHWLVDEQFQAAVGRFIDQETSGIHAYKQNAEQLLPFRKGND